MRIVLAEKGVTADIVEALRENPPAELSELNPYNTLPTLVDRDLTIYETRVMMEYLDERFPHPPLLPVYPVTRAEIRQFIYRVESDWCPLVDTIVRSKSKDTVAAAVKELRESLVTVAPIFAEKEFFMSEEFTLVDCCLAPILWRSEQLGFEIPNTKQTQPLREYMERLFKRPAFIESLSELEKEMQPSWIAM